MATIIKEIIVAASADTVWRAVRDVGAVHQGLVRACWRAKHHNASIQIFPHEHGSRLVWITDVLPDELAEPIRALVDEGARVMKQTLERSPTPE